MARLIDADDVKELLLGLDSLPWEEEVDDLVDRISTAYDVDAVVKDIKNNADVSTPHHFSIEHNVAIRVDDAIEIVKAGGKV
jgi:hypothetical protein